MAVDVVSEDEGAWGGFLDTERTMRTDEMANCHGESVRWDGEVGVVGSAEAAALEAATQAAWRRLRLLMAFLHSSSTAFLLGALPGECVDRGSVCHERARGEGGARAGGDGVSARV